MKTTTCVFLLVAVSLLAATGQSAETQDEQFLSGLQQRRLFTLAELYCRDALNEQNLSDSRRAELTTALCRTLAQHALNTPPSQREQIWQAATDAAAQFARAAPQSPRLVLVEMQLALSQLARGELARQEAEIGGAGAPSLEEARRELGKVTRELDRLGEQVQVELRAATARRGETLSEDELISLSRNIRFQHARALRNQALCYPPDSPERADSLLQAMAIASSLAAAHVEGNLDFDAKLEEVACLRLHGKLQDAIARLDELDAARPNAKTQLMAKAERVRLLLAAKRASDALVVLRSGREIAGQTSAEFDLAHVETFIELWKQADEAKNAAEAKEWQNRAAGMVQAMERLYGRYWTRRGEMLLSSSASGGKTADVEILLRAAKNHYLRKEFPEAVGAYERAAAQSLAAGDKAQSLDLYYAASVIEQRHGDRTKGMEKQQTASLLLRDQTKAPQIHLQAVLFAAQLARDGQPESLNNYMRRLESHIATWPNDPTSDQARLWWGRILEHQRKLSDAIRVYQSINPASSAEYGEAVGAAARCWEQSLAARRQTGENVEAAADAAAQHFEAIILGPEGRVPERWSSLALDAALHAARLRLLYSTNSFASARSLLEAALRGGTDAPAAWQTAAKSLLVIAQAGAGDREAAKQTLAGVAGGSAGAQIEMLRGLGAIAQQSSPAVRQDLATLELEVVSLLRPQAAKLNAVDRTELDIVEAQALAAAGQSQQALAKFQLLAKANPDRGDVQEGYAQLLDKGNDRPTLETALAQWREVLRRSPANSPRWFRAKYGIALAHYRLGQPEEAAALIRLLQTLQPNLGGDETKARFLELLAACQK